MKDKVGDEVKDNGHSYLTHHGKMLRAGRPGHVACGLGILPKFRNGQNPAGLKGREKAPTESVLCAWIPSVFRHTAPILSPSGVARWLSSGHLLMSLQDGPCVRPCESRGIAVLRAGLESLGPFGRLYRALICPNDDSVGRDEGPLALWNRGLKSSPGLPARNRGARTIEGIRFPASIASGKSSSTPAGGCRTQ